MGRGASERGPRLPVRSQADAPLFVVQADHPMQDLLVELEAVPATAVPSHLVPTPWGSALIDGGSGWTCVGECCADPDCTSGQAIREGRIKGLEEVAVDALRARWQMLGHDRYLGVGQLARNGSLRLVKQLGRLCDEIFVLWDTEGVAIVDRAACGGHIHPEGDAPAMLAMYADAADHLPALLDAVDPQTLVRIGSASLCTGADELWVELHADQLRLKARDTFDYRRRELIDLREGRCYVGEGACTHPQLRRIGSSVARAVRASFKDWS